MNYEILFYCILFFFIGRASTWTLYIGTDRSKYEKANIGILLKP